MKGGKGEGREEGEGGGKCIRQRIATGNGLEKSQ